MSMSISQGSPTRGRRSCRCRSVRVVQHEVGAHVDVDQSGQSNMRSALMSMSISQGSPTRGRRSCRCRSVRVVQHEVGAHVDVDQSG